MKKDSCRMGSVSVGTDRRGHSPCRSGKDRSVVTGHNSPPSSEKAGEMLEHGRVRGHRLTAAQRRYFRAIEHGWRPTRLK